MQSNLIDITFTVRPAEAQGRRLFRDLNTGQILWEPVEPLPTASVEQPSADPAPPVNPVEIAPVIMQAMREEEANSLPPAPKKSVKARVKRLIHAQKQEQSEKEPANA